MTPTDGNAQLFLSIAKQLIAFIVFANDVCMSAFLYRSRVTFLALLEA